MSAQANNNIIDLGIKKDLADKVIRVALVHGEDIIKLIGQTGLPRHEIEKVLRSTLYTERMKAMRKDPREVIPQLSELYARLTDEAKNAASSRDRQAALKVLIEAKKAEIGLEELDGYR